MSDRILIDVDEHVAHVRLNRPEKMNALDAAMLEALNALPERLERLDDLRAVVLSGEGASFCAGLDLESFAGSPEVLEQAFAPVPGASGNYVQNAALCWRRVPVPVIAAVTGHCLGGGLQIALGADIRIGGPDATLSVMEIRWGIVPDMGATRTLRHLVRLDIAKELTLTGRRVEAEEAASIGLLTRVDDDPVASALGLAREIAAHSPDATRATKQLFDEGFELDEEQGLALEARIQLALIGRKNQLEAVQANMSGREASFSPAQFGKKT